jgi:HTH domain
MDSEQRRQAVKELLAEKPSMSQRAIAKVLDCSQASIRRDMAALGVFRGSPVTRIAPQPRSPQVNGGLSRGDSLVARLRGEMAEQGLIPTSVEEEHLSTAKDLADRIERLQRMVEADGERRKLKDGTIRLHPALAEIRQCESVLSRVISGIQTMETAVKNPKKQRAANTRWRSHNLAAVERDRKVSDPYGS